MKNQKKHRLPPPWLPLLSEGRERNRGSASFSSKRARRLGAILSFLLCGAVLFLAVGGGMIGLFSSRSANRLAEWMAEFSFMDLSGDGAGKQTDLIDEELSDLLDGILSTEETDSSSSQTEKQPSELDSSEETLRPPLTLETLYSFDYTKIPDGSYPIVPMDLSLSNFGNTYINNATGLTPDPEALLRENFPSSVVPMSFSSRKEPKVLILHTHGTEAYSEDGATFYEDDGGELARSEDVSANVVAVGKVLADALNEAGISALHCTVMHDQAQYKDSYARAKETVRRYLSEYPSIRLVIDLHRDSILKSDGSLVRPVTVADGEAAAQVMCVVGSNWSGGTYDTWERNLSLALKLRATLNEETPRLCRPVYLKSSTYNQELAPYSLLLEIGSSGNSLEEAKRAAVMVAKGLCEWIPKL